jgi:hypothetical protein
LVDGGRWARRDVYYSISGNTPFLVFTLQLRIFENKQTLSHRYLYPSYKAIELPLDLQKLKRDSNNCDVILNCFDSETVSVHSAILCARSTVFTAMFTNKMEENTTKLIDMSSDEVETVELFVDALYTDNNNLHEMIDLSSERIFKLFTLAHRYEVDCLLGYCEVRLCDATNSDNALEMLQFAEVYNSPRLKHKTASIIVDDNKNKYITVPTTNTTENIDTVLAA